MERRVRGMTHAQSDRVCEAVLPLTRDWLRDQGAENGKYGAAAAMADLERGCYVAFVRFDYAAANGHEARGELVWRLDADFAPIGEPEVRSDPRA